MRATQFSRIFFSGNCTKQKKYQVANLISNNNGLVYGILDSSSSILFFMLQKMKI